MGLPALHQGPETAGAAGGAAQQVLLGRQTIYDRHRQVHGYELLFRRGTASSAGTGDGNLATAEVVLNAITGIGIDVVSSGEPLFVNCTRQFLDRAPLLPPSRFVLEVLEDIEIDADLLERMRALRSAGYKLALDDFTLRPGAMEAVKLADYVKLDLLALNEHDLGEHVQALRPLGVSLVAEKVESESQLLLCQRLGFDLFQGFYLRRPDVLSRARLTANRLAGLRVIADCYNPDKSLHQIAAAISSDVGLSYALLRVANSGMFGARVRVDSIQQAATRLGTEMIARWAALLVVVSPDQCPSGYVQAALHRAFLCEALARRERLSGRGYFLVGLLSVLDAVTGAPMADILASLPLAENIRGALERFEGPHGRVLRAVLEYEAGNWEHVPAAGFSTETLAAAFWDAVAQTDKLMASVAKGRSPERQNRTQASSAAPPAPSLC